MTPRRCLNLGCGEKQFLSTEGEVWINVDSQPLPGVHVVRDLRRGLPFDDGSFDHVYLDNVLEHFGQDDAIFLLNEMDRVLRDEGTCDIIVPHADSQGAKQDPTHRSFWVPRSWLYWNQTTTRYGGRFVGITANFYAIDRPRVYQGAVADEVFIEFKLVKRLPPE